ncbi:hypothetical protein GN244_ATG08200 [Phytophthora infestans]|uniref:Uncharacterized protein n=1 Tax=Phytophthora infestans TaxID=4787 RepID=A0A833T511_PHYIN|nr:hypothetical protein GN244_ATG08200 [Phytophthora infestans]KAF4138700.1 hypothetical protein GN958_ATG12104 [Phytophthora infestans]KAF4143841.1 hypothetical protein GN958_ATG06927 [Phytophthora infestans]
MKNPTLVKLLHKNDQISDESISAAFSKACKAKRTYSHQSDGGDNRMKVVRYLGKLDCILAEVIGEAFAYAAEHFDSKILDYLPGDARLPPEVVFLNAFMHDMMTSAYDVERYHRKQS